MKYSKQKELILQTVKENRIHPTAEAVYEMVREKIPNISLATVYRNLNKMSEKGLLKKLDNIDGVARFDGETSEHHHFVCEKCGQIFDLDKSDFPALEKIAENKSNFIIKTYDITLKGVCYNCSVKN